MKGKWKSEKGSVQFFFKGVKEVYFASNCKTRIYFEKPKRIKSWVTLGQPATSTVNSN